MRLLNFFRWLLRRKKQEEAFSSDATALLQRFEAISSLEAYELPKDKEPQTFQFEKESLQLGIAAGYTGRSLKAIESSLTRIESQMITRDWFDLNFGQKIKELIDISRQHEEKEQLRFEAIQEHLNSLKNLANFIPQPIRSQVYKQIQAIESKLPPSPRMKEILAIIKKEGEISYEDLARRLNLKISGLRGLLSNMAKRISDIERFEKDRKGWIRFIGNKDLKRSQSDAKEETLSKNNTQIIVENSNSFTT